MCLFISMDSVLFPLVSFISNNEIHYLVLMRTIYDGNRLIDIILILKTFTKIYSKFLIYTRSSYTHRNATNAMD